MGQDLGLEFRVTGVLREKEALLTQQKICGGKMPQQCVVPDFHFHFR